jgi:NADPH-ferrihemoprotein reductase
VHVTAVVLKYESLTAPRWVHGVGSNFLLNVKHAANGETAAASEELEHVSLPAYAIEGSRGAHKTEDVCKIPVHVRRSTFKPPTNPNKSPVIMIGPGTVSLFVKVFRSFPLTHTTQGVAPFRGFIQERVALACRTIEKKGDDALADWGQISLFYGCRKSRASSLPSCSLSLPSPCVVRTSEHPVIHPSAFRFLCLQPVSPTHPPVLVLLV